MDETRVFQYRPPTPDRKIKTIRDGRPEQKREDTVEHLSQEFFPVNPQILKQAKDAVTSHDRNRALAAIKSDPALFLHCVKNLNTLVERRDVGFNPLAALRELEEDKLAKLIPENARQVSKHSLENASETQALRIQHSVLSSTAAERIANEIEIEPELAFSATIFRQLGLNLVAWSYPAVYSRALVAQRRNGTELDTEVENLLGVSPSEIGSRLAVKWGMSGELRQALTPDLVQPASSAAPEKPLREGSPAKKLRDLCRISETYAASKDTKYFPAAKEKWSTAQVVLKDFCADTVFEQIEQSARQVLREHASGARVYERLPMVERAQREEGPRSLFDKNQFLRRCPEEVTDAFKMVYGSIHNGQFSLEAMRLLIDKLPPLIGFRQGCLYLLDMETLTLQPSLRFGRHTLSEYGKFFANNRETIIDSLDSLVPLKQFVIGIDSRMAATVTGALRNGNHPGVLYVELTQRASEEVSHPSNIYFQAFRSAIDHCLGSTN